MGDSKARFMGGHYDSTKQMSVFKNSLNRLSMGYMKAEEGYYTKSKIRLMLDILFSKTVVLTYAQFLDGFFYHRMVRNYYGDNFVQALKNDRSAMGAGLKPMIEIRIWPNEEDLKSTMYSWMIRKEGFSFSSLESYQSGLSNKFHEFARNYFKSPEKISLDDTHFKREIERSFGEEDDNTYLSNWIEDMSIMQVELPGAYTKKWERDFNACLMLAKDTFTDQYPEISTYIDSLKAKYQSEATQELFMMIINDLDDNGIIPDRSKVFDKLTTSGLEDEEKDKIRGMYNSLYNKTMAIQHKCQLSDEGINDKVTKRADNLIDKLSTRTIDKLGKMDWVEYFRLLRNLQGLRETLWLSDNDEFKDNARNLVREFMVCINAESSMGMLASQVVKTFMPNVASGTIKAVIQYLSDANLLLAGVVFDQLVLLLVNLGFKGDQARELAKRLDDACTLVKYATNNMLGGGSNPCFEDTNYLAWTSKQSGTVADAIDPIAVVASESFTNEDGQLNSIYRGGE